MRTLLLIPLLTTLLLAQDDAADLFYKAFWLEQAAGKVDEAETLYREVVEKHKKAPEAPRALLGLIRIRAARGLEVTEFVTILERDYPDAKEQLEQARELAAEQRTPFSPGARPDDSPVVAKIKALYFQLREGEVSKEAKVFLADLGPRAHPMLATLLRSMDAAPVQRATSILLMQRTAAADAVIERALRDDKALFRTVIVDTVARDKRLPPELARAIAGLYDDAAPLLRASIVRAMGKVVESKEPEVFDLLRRALNDADPDVRKIATLLAGNNHESIPDRLAEALVAAFERGATYEPYLSLLPNLASRPGLAPRIEKLLVEGPYVQAYMGVPADDPAYALLARVAVARRTVETSSNSQYQNVKTIAERSPAGVAEVLRGALRTGDTEVIRWCDQPNMEARLAPYAVGLKKEALAGVYDEDKGRAQAAAQVLALLGLDADDWPVVRDLLEAHKGEGIPAIVVQQEFLAELGVERATQLADYGAKPGDWSQFLQCSAGLLNRFGAADTLPFYAAVVPHTEANCARALHSLAGNAALQPLIAMHMLRSDGPEWNWETQPGDRRRRDRHGRAVLDACDEAWKDPAVRKALYEAAADPRLAIAATALKVAKDDESDEATAAFARALDSPWEKMQREALAFLGKRHAGAPVARFLARDQLSDDLRSRAFMALAGAGDATHAPVVRAYLDRREENDSSYRAWDAYLDLAPKAAVDLALEEIAGEGGPGFRAGALRTLTQTADERRIAVFRRILRGEIDASVYTVLSTVADQYLIELGEETLLHLRSPDQKVREAATRAVERLKFYADAKRAFKD